MVYMKPPSLEMKMVLRNGIATYLSSVNVDQQVPPMVVEQIVQNDNFYKSVSVQTLKKTFSMTYESANAVYYIIGQVLDSDL